MPDATKRPIAEWRETEWLQHLQRQAQRLTACPYLVGRGSAAVRGQRQHAARVSARIGGEIRGILRV